MSKQILSLKPQTATAKLTPAPSGILQRKCACGNHTVAGGECAGCAKNKSGLQRKLAIGSSNDPLEHEADHIANQVLAAPAQSAVSGAPPRIQRFSGQSNGQMDAAPASVDHIFSSSGRVLDFGLRQDMEQRFGHDFSRVRVHSGGAAEQSARDVNANAYTVGHNIVFGAGQFAPGTHEGRRLIAHELTHVVQQSGSQLCIGVQRKQGNRAPLSSIQGLPMSALLIELIKLPETVLDDEEEGQLVGGPRLVVAMQAVRAKLQLGLTDFLQSSRAALQALPPDQSVDILKFLAAPAETKSQKLNTSSADKIVGAPMGGTYEDYKNETDYLDNFSSAGYDPHSNTLHLFYPDGGEAVLKLPLLSVGGKSFLVFERKTLLDTPGANDYKIYPTVPNSRTLPNIAQWLTDHAEEIQQSNLVLQAGTGALTARSIPPNLWWLALLAPAASLGARFLALPMRPAFKSVAPEPGEIPIIKAGVGKASSSTATTPSRPATQGEIPRQLTQGENPPITPPGRQLTQGENPPITPPGRQLTQGENPPIAAAPAATASPVIAQNVRNPNVNVGSAHPWTGRGAPPQWGNPKSGKAYGDVNTSHGPSNTPKFFRDVMRNKKIPQSQFYSEKDWVAAERLAPMHPGEYIVEMGRPVGRVYQLPDGTTITENVTRVFIQRDPDGKLNSIYPVDNNFKL
jgi:hypothetical protein